MQPIYRKKKRNTGPSKNEEKIERGRQAEAMNRQSNSLGARYPSVNNLVVHLAFLGAQQQSLGEETRKYGQNDPCDFAVPCPGMCGVGSFDLAAKISAVIGNQEERSEGGGTCQERLHAGTGPACGCSLKCRVEVSYRS